MKRVIFVFQLHVLCNSQNTAILPATKYNIQLSQIFFYSPVPHRKNKYDYGLNPYIAAYNTEGDEHMAVKTGHFSSDTALLKNKDL